MESRLDQTKCKQCRLCIEVCPCNILAMNDHDEVYFIPGREVICQKCGQCMAVCTSGAISVEGLSYERDFTLLPENQMDHRKLMDFFAHRRSIRNFKNKQVPDELIARILDSVSYAPFGSQPEKMNITVVNNREIIESALPFIEEFLDNIVRWIDHPIAYQMIKRRNSSETFNTIKNHLYPISAMGNYKLEYGDRITRDAPCLILFHAPREAEEHTHNSLVYATYCMLAALSLGLGASMNGIVPNALNKVKQVREIFRVPEDHEAIIGLILGYPKYKYRRAIRRQYHTINWLN